MKQNIVIVGTSVSSFIVSSIREFLKAEEYDVSCVEPKVNELHEVTEKENGADMFIIYAGEYIESSTNALVFIKDYCVENEKKVYLIGYNQEINELKKIIPENLIQHTFERPLNVKLLVDHINNDVAKALAEGTKKHILVVDDSGTMLRTIKSWLSGKYKVSAASSATMAISFLAANKPDLILLDYEMPICSGPQFLEMIRAEVTTSTIPVIFLTAKDDAESVKKVLNLKPSGYLLKTMKPDEILTNIDNFFEKRKG